LAHAAVALGRGPPALALALTHALSGARSPSVLKHCTERACESTARDSWCCLRHCCGQPDQAPTFQ
jgi:hypothetical protein